MFEKTFFDFININLQEEEKLEGQVKVRWDGCQWLAVAETYIK
jgi:hypothetical protein